MISYLKGNGNFFSLPSERWLKKTALENQSRFIFCSEGGQMREKKESGAFQLHQVFIFLESFFICQRGIVSGLINDFIIAFIGKNGR